MNTDIALPPGHEQTLRHLVAVFLEENQKLNLSALRDAESCWIGNVLDSLAVLDLPAPYSLPPSGRILDLGTGGGFPLLPLAICLPQAALTGLDATRKKIDAVGRITGAMQLQNVTLVAGRTEELGRDPAYREQFDVVTARAVAPLPVLLEHMAPFTKVNGYCIAWKSLHIEAELQASVAARSALDCHLVKTHEYELPGDWGKRQLLVFQKTKPTPETYPRAVGTAKKSPLR